MGTRDAQRSAGTRGRECACAPKAEPGTAGYTFKLITQRIYVSTVREENAMRDTGWG
jgi:hypothetical protein